MHRDPIFIVGMPRSGTKLLRSLLNRHPDIAISNIETDFFFHWVRRWERYGDLSHDDRFQAFYREAVTLPYFTYRRESGRLIAPSVWYAACSDFTVQDVFGALLRHDTGATEATRWGDKSPSYITRIEALHRFFPGARFVHIVRDVRDYCLSIKTAWNKNIYRAAQRWFDDNRECIRQCAAIGSACALVTFEDLIADPQATLQRLSRFLEVDYTAQMTRLVESSENLGDASGHKRILAHNKGKYLTRMPPHQIERIEAITAPLLHALGYACNRQAPAKRLGRPWMRWYQLLDGLNLLRFERRVRGTADALSYCYRYYRASGNREY